MHLPICNVHVCVPVASLLILHILISPTTCASNASIYGHNEVDVVISIVYVGVIGSESYPLVMKVVKYIFANSWGTKVV